MPRLNRNQLKYLAAAAMLLDHIAWAYADTFSAIGLLLHFIGRLTGPTMAFFLAEGYRHTRSTQRYLLRLGIFAMVSWVPFSLFETGTWPTTHFGVIYTLFLGLLAAALWENEKLSQPVRLTGIFLLLMLSCYGDWPVFDVVLPLVLIAAREDPEKRWRAFCTVCLCAVFAYSVGGSLQETLLLLVMNSGILMVPLLLYFCYNGEAGSSNPFHKWFFYVFYPIHLLVLWMLKQYTGV